MVETGQDEQEERLFSAERLVFFSDAVVAIAITLLALELPLPEGDTNRAVLHEIAHNRDDYLAFLISFLVIARSWTGHHHLFGFVTSLAPGLMRWNMMWLLMIVITPFVTRLLTSGSDGFQVRFILYAVVQALSGIFFAMILRSVQQGGVLKENTPPDLVPGSYRRLFGFVAGFLLSIPVAFFTPWAYALWAVVPSLGGVAGRFVRSRRGSGAAPDGLW